MNWYFIFLLICLGFVFVVLKTKEKKYVIYAVAGSLFGFYFDIVSFSLGFYSYPPLYAVTIFGLPVSMTIAEGFSVAITFYVFDKLRNLANITL